MDTTSQRVVAATSGLAVIVAGLADCAGQVQGAQPSPVTMTAVMPSGTAAEVPTGQVVRKEDRDAARLATITGRVSAADQKAREEVPRRHVRCPPVKATAAKAKQKATASARVAGSKATAPRVQSTPGKKVSPSCPMVNGSFQC